MGSIKHIIKWKTILLYAAVAICVVPVIWACFYGVPSADDFYRMGDYVHYNPTGNAFFYPFWFTTVLYESTQGTFFTNFLQGIPLWPEIGIWGIRFLMVLNAALFFQSIWVFIRAALKRIGAIKNKRDLLVTLLFLLFLFFILCETDLGESFYWMNGLCAYAMPLSVSLFSITCYLQFAMTSKKRYLVTGVILAVLGSGGVLMVTAFHCMVFLLLLIYGIFSKEITRGKLLFGIAALAGAIINVADPAYVVRSQTYDTQLRGLQACKISVERDLTFLGSYLQAGILLVVLLVSFVVLYYRLRDSVFRFRLPGVVTALCFLGIWITDFPVALGYSSEKFPARCVFVLNVAMIFYLLVITAYWAGWCANKELFSFSPQWIFLVGVICFTQIAGYMIPQQLKELTPNKMLIHLIHGDYKRFSDNQMTLLYRIEESDDEDVLVYEEMLPETVWTNLQPVGLREDPSHWINEGVARYYWKNSVQVIPLADEIEQE